MKINARTITFVLLLLAIAVSGYLSYLKIANANAVCLHGGRFDCGTVLNSKYSEFLGIPIAYLGLGTNLVVLALLILQRPSIPLMDEFGTVFIFGVLLFAFIFSVYLVYIQAFVILAYCPWCLTHEVLVTLMFLIWTWELIKLLRGEDEAEPLPSGD